MAGLLTLLSLSMVMAVASFLAGILPLSLTLTQSQLRLISTMGMGVLVGTSLIVIIPEGVETLYSSYTPSKLHTRSSLHSRGLDVRWVSPSAPYNDWQLHVRGLDAPIDPFNVPGPVLPGNIDIAPPRTPTEPGVVGALQETASGEGSTKDAEQNHKEDNDTSSPHAWVGVALITGFILMYLIDKLPQYTTPSRPRVKTHHISLNNLGRRFNLASSLDREEEADNFIEATQSDESKNRGFATTTGLVIHAAADGVALGASLVTSHSNLSFIIFFAIMVHKAPAAFGLTSVLLKQGLSKRTARAHLLLFSLAAPAGALLTYILAGLLGGSSGRTAEGTAFWTGNLLLFSAGTFLYVAMHAMQQNSELHQDPAGNTNGNGFIDGREGVQQQQSKPSIIDLGAACFGMILPLFLQIGHAH